MMLGLGLEAIPDDERHTLESPDASPWQALAEKRQRAAESTERDFTISLYDGLVVARYRRLPLAELGPHKKRMLVLGSSEKFGEMFDAYADFLVTACVAIKAKPAPDGSFVQVASGYLNDLADVFGFRPVTEKEGATEIVRSVFAGNEEAVEAHGEEVFGWMYSDAILDEENAAGEFGGRTRPSTPPAPA